MRSLSYTLLFLFAALASGQDHSQTKSTDAKTAQVDQGKEQKTPPPIQSGTPQSTAEASNKETKTKAEPHPWLTHGEWVMSGLTLIYVLLTAFYACTSHKTLKALEQQGMDAKLEATVRDVQFGEQLKVSKDAARAALLNATAVINAERPWIVVTLKRHEEQAYYMEGRERHVFGLRFTPLLTNYGRTLAKLESFRICNRAFNSTDDMPEIPEYVDGLPAVFQNALMIIPQGTREEAFTDVSSIFDREVFADFGEGRQLFACFGRVEYRDLLTPDVLHETRFSFIYRYRIDDLVIEGPSEYTSYT